VTPLHSRAGPARHAIEVRRSRFIAQAGPAATPEAAADFLARGADPDARHNCWAWRVGARYRFHDADEPAGTAGRPILMAIDAQGLDHVAVLVTRFFGGIKLGAGGLARAYGGCAAECLRQAPRVALVEFLRIRIAVPFEAVGAVHQLLAAHAALRLVEAYAPDGIEIEVELPADRRAAFEQALRDSTRGRAQVRLLEAPGRQASA
jgi:putative IMPACT (imprinted ancient) family translation regulator